LGTVPDAFQAQIKILGDNSFDVLYRYENIGWSGGSPNIVAGSTTVTLRSARWIAGLSGYAGDVGAGVWGFQIRNNAVFGVPLPQGDVLLGGEGNDWLEGAWAMILSTVVRRRYPDRRRGQRHILGRFHYRRTTTDTVTDFQAGLGGDVIQLPSWATPSINGQTSVLVRQDGADTLVQSIASTNRTAATPMTRCSGCKTSTPAI